VFFGISIKINFIFRVILNEGGVVRLNILKLRNVNIFQVGKGAEV